jgi:hypothetical protein
MIRTVVYDGLDSVIDWIKDNRGEVDALLQRLIRLWKTETAPQRISGVSLAPLSPHKPVIKESIQNKRPANILITAERLAERAVSRMQKQNLGVSADAPVHAPETAGEHTRDPLEPFGVRRIAISLLAAKDLDEVEACIDTMDSKLLKAVTLRLQEMCSVQRARSVLSLSEHRAAVLRHFALTFSRDKAWSAEVNKRCWPPIWVRVSEIEEYFARRCTAESYFNPYACKEDFVVELSKREQKVGLRPYSWTNTISKLTRRSNGTLVPVLTATDDDIGLESLFYRSYVTSPEHKEKAEAALRARIQSRVRFSQLPPRIQARAASAAEHLAGKIVCGERDYLRIAKVIHEGINWSGKPAPKEEVLADCIVDGLVSRQLKVADPPARWDVSVRARYYEIILSYLDKEGL